MHIESFDSIEDAFAAMDAAEQSANESLHPKQILLRDGDESSQFWIRPEPSVGIIFGRAWSWREQCVSSLGYLPGVDAQALVAQHASAQAVADAVPSLSQPEGTGDAAEWAETALEVAYSIRATASGRARGYLFGEAYSAPFPEAELGDTHVANAWPISEAAFEEARAVGWEAVDVVGAGDDDAARRFGGTPVLVRELKALEEEVAAYRGRQ